jgi:phosphatidylinositol alpha-mannosyltransferase
VRVALVCPYSWSVPGGVQTHVRGLAQALRARGVDVDVLAPADGASDGIVELGRTIPIPSNGSIQRVALAPTAAARTRRAVRNAYDVVHVHEPMLPAVCLAALASSRAPVVATFHMHRSSLLWYRVFAPLVRRANRRLSARIAVSRAAARYAQRALGGELRVIPNGVDVDALASLPPERNGNRILFVGRPEPRKGLRVLLDAFARVSDAELVLVGPTGSFGPRVHALGRVDDARLRRELARADVVCAPSLGGESFGVVLVEAMAAGVPVVASSLPAYEDVLPREAGLLVPAGDAGALAAALAALLRDDELRSRMGAAGRRAARRYDWSRVVDEILDVYGIATTRSPRRSSSSSTSGSAVAVRSQDRGAP